MERQWKYEGTCPRCGGQMPNAMHPGRYPGALSRWDNKTYICSGCGEEEAGLQYSYGNQVSRQAAEDVIHPVTGRSPWIYPPKEEA